MATITNTIRWASNTAELQRNLEQGLDQIEAVTKGADRLARSLNTDAISAGHKWAAAVTKIGGVTKLTTDEKARMHAALTKTLEKYQALDRVAPTALVRLHEQTKPVVEQTNRLTASMVAIGTAVGTFIGNLAYKAVSSLASGIVDLAKRGLTLAPIVTSFDRLTKSIGESGDEMLRVGRSSTKGLITDLDLMSAANKAILLGLPLTAQSFGTLAGSATVLGRAMRQDAGKSLDDLITALGRSSPLILDNLGLTVKVGEANEIYARQVGKSVTSLTDAEKKLAFYNAAMTAAEQKVATLGGIQLTFADRIQQVKVAFTNVTDALGVAIARSPVVNAAFGAIGDAVQAAMGDNQVTLVQRLVGTVNKVALFLAEVASVGVSAAGILYRAWSVLQLVFAGVMTAVFGVMEGLTKGIAMTLEVAAKVPGASHLLGGMAAAARENATQLEGMRRSFVDQTKEAWAGVTGNSAFHQTLNGLQRTIGTVKGAMAAAASQQASSASIAEDLTKSTQGLAGSQDAAGESAAKLKKELQGMSQAFSGATLAADVKKANDAIALLTNAELNNPAVIGRIAARASELSGQGAILTGALRDVWIAQSAWRAGMPAVETGLASIAKRAEDVTKKLGGGGVLGGLTSFLKIGTGPITFGQNIKIAPPTGALKSFGEFFKNDMSKVLMGAFQGGGSALKSIGASIGGFLTSGSSSIGKAIGGGLSSLMGKGLGGALGSFLPGVGTMLGGLLGSKLGGIFGGLFGKSKKALLDDDATKQIQQLQKELLNTHGSLDQVSRMGKIVGVDLAAAWGLRGQAGLRDFTALMEEFEEKQQRLQGALERYGLTWMDLGEQARAAHLDQVAEGLIDDFEILQTAGADVTRIVDGMSGSINTFLTNALRTGAAIPPAMQPMIEQLIRSGQLTEQNAALLLGLQHEAVPAWDDIKAAAERYGIALDSMGPKIEQIRISEAAAQIVDDWEFLIGAGADAGAVMAGMADEVQELVKSALAFGLELPAAMKPMLEQMVAAGLLTDATGGKLTDLAGIKFAEPLSESVDRLIEALDRLVASLNGDVNRALDSVARDRTFVVKGRVEFDPQTQLPGGSVGVDTAHSGGFAMATGIQKHHQGTARILKFHSGVANLASDEVPAILQVGESVLNRRATQEIGPAAIRAMNAGRGGGAGVTRVEMRTGMLEEQLAGLRQDMRDQADKTYRAIRDAFQQGAA